MQPQIALSGWYGIVAIWQFSNNKWTLIELTRLNSAIGMCRHYKHQDSSWLVFPTKFSPMECQDQFQSTSKPYQLARLQSRKRKRVFIRAERVEFLSSSEATASNHPTAAAGAKEEPDF